MKSDSLKRFNQTQAGVFHATHWGQSIPENFVKELICEAEQNFNRKARLCLHPSPEDITQVTFLALTRPYEDRLHKHPQKPEIMIPFLGKAELKLYYEDTSENQVILLDAESSTPVSIEAGVLHSLRVLTPNFVFLEIGNGPFKPDSTVYA
jgi:cupin fold WbuC family metalloprotein